MADLAIIVSIMLGYTLLAGALAIFAIRRPPNGLFTRMLIMVLLLPALYLSFRLLIVCQLSGINSISISLDYSQCQYSISFTCSTERGGVRARLTACVCRCQYQCQFCQFSFCQLSFVSSQHK